MLKLYKVFLSSKVYCLGLRKPRVCFVWLFIRRGCKIFCQLEHEHLRSYCRVTRLNKLLFLFVLRKVNMQCSLVPPFPCFLVSLSPCSPVLPLPWARSIQPKFRPVRPGKEDHLKRWTCFFETFPVGPNRSIEFWTEISRNFGWMDRGPCSPVTLFPNESLESFPSSSVNLKFFTQMKRPHNSVNGRGIFTSSVSERLISIFHPLSSLS